MESNSLVSPEIQYEDLKRRWSVLQYRENCLDMWERDLRSREDHLNMIPLNLINNTRKKKYRKNKDYASMAVQPVEK